MLDEPEISFGDAGRGISHRRHRAVARDARQVLPVGRGKRVRVLRRVSFPRLGLEGEDETASRLGGRENDGRWLNPKAALDGKPRTARHGRERLADGAVQLKPRAAARSRATTRNHAARDGEPRAALGEGRS